MHTLLLADDSVTIQRVIELTFADEDVRVVAVSDGGEAIAMLDRTPPDIVLADVGMPGQNGYEVARHIRDTPRLAHIPIVLLTGAFEPIDQAKVAEVGCDGVLAKPFEPQLVIDRVKELLAKPRDRAAPAIEPSAPVPEPVPPREDVDSYFDRLDAAFTNLAGSAAPHSEGPPLSSSSVTDRPERLAPLHELSAPAAAADAAHSTSEALNDPRSAATTPSASVAPPAPTPLSGATFPPLADAFAALLEAEQTAPAPIAAPAWPAASTPTALPDDIVEQVTRRVLEQLSDRVVRETTVDIVSSVAERLVKEEIERIKRHINEVGKG